MIIKALVEDTTRDSAFLSEHGLSLYIEANGRKVLFDAGQSPAFARNAEKLGVDLSQVDFAVLSHAHYDHGGGLRAFLMRNDHAPVYISPYAFDECLNGVDEYIGLDKTLQGHSRLVFAGEKTRLPDGFSVYPGEGRPLVQPVSAYGLQTRRNGAVIPDDFRHEQYLEITENGRCVLISGCSHKGIVNIVHWFRPDVLVGGFHLMKLDPQAGGRAALDAVAQELANANTVFHTCHCTGVPQYKYLKRQMQDRVFYLSAGQEISV
ncbi:MAG: MBL fold metallo-hydrolase [Clostridiales bacterium]|nr:MBL fold metallo-hydrolase [Clostridiales bacterium]